MNSTLKYLSLAALFNAEGEACNAKDTAKRKKSKADPKVKRKRKMAKKSRKRRGG